MLLCFNLYEVFKGSSKEINVNKMKGKQDEGGEFRIATIHINSSKSNKQYPYRY